MNVVYFSKGARGRVCLAALTRTAHRVVAVVATDPEADLTALCRDYGIQLLVERNPNTESFAGQLRALRADVFVCSGYSKILKPIVFSIPPKGTINLHGGRLPQYRGAAPINWQIINGERVGGCCVLYVDEGIDTAPILRQELYDISSDDTHQTVLDRTLEIFPRILVDVLDDIERGSAAARPQSREEGCYFSRRYPDDSRIAWAGQTDEEVHNLVRGMWGPYPHAFTTLRGEKLDVERTSILAETIRGIPGRVALKRDDGVVVICRNRGVLVREVRRDGAVLPARDVLRTGDTVS